ncbi:putative quinol monooxygenase [Polaribacter sp. Asnod1-A03]|uniref:putative quinol monooxygenase n=1 Tax=Polaribacter sp. Asnod1-A03 TaxID=3160581 RepID=UPI00386CF2B8
MFVRIVELSFHQKNIEEFLLFFESKKPFIRASKGCNLLELYQDKQNPEIFFTYSYWDKEEDLENYRNSNFFKEVWVKLKTFF